MATPTTTASSLTNEQLVEMLGLIKGADSVELKLTVPETDQRSAIQALEIDPLDAQMRQVVFFDTPDLKLYEHGVVVRARRVQGKGDDSVVKLRPVVPNTLPSKLRKSPNFGVEVDAMPGGFVCSGSLKAYWGPAPVKAVLRGEMPIRKLFSKEQRAFYDEHAPAGIGLDDLVPARSDQRPEGALRAGRPEPTARRRAVVLSERLAHPRALDQIAARRGVPGGRGIEGVPGRTRRVPDGCAADQDKGRPGALRQGQRKRRRRDRGPPTAGRGDVTLLEAGDLIEQLPGDRIHVAGAIKPDERQVRASPCLDDGRDARLVVADAAVEDGRVPIVRATLEHLPAADADRGRRVVRPAACRADHAPEHAVAADGLGRVDDDRDPVVDRGGEPGVELREVSREAVEDHAGRARRQARDELVARSGPPARRSRTRRPPSSPAVHVVRPRAQLPTRASAGRWNSARYPDAASRWPTVPLPEAGRPKRTSVAISTPMVMRHG